MPLRRFISLLFLLLLTISCSPLSTPTLNEPWAYANLLSLDAADAPSPGWDLIALYTRFINQELQIRLDWLDLPDPPDYDLYLALDTSIGGTTILPLDIKADIAWDTLLVIPANGSIQVLEPDFNPRMNTAALIIRDPVLDNLIISLNLESLRSAQSDGWPAPAYRIQVFLTPAGSKTLVDQLGPVRTDATPPPSVPVLLAFWNCYPAYTPALALRRWDGVHTGPFGGRHGLYNLLRTAQSAGVPIALLDLKSPASLAALDYVDGLRLVQDMTDAGLLILPEMLAPFPQVPDPLQNEFLGQVLASNREIDQAFNLAPSPFIYSPGGRVPQPLQAKVVFTHPTRPETNVMGFKPVVITRWGDLKIVPVQLENSPVQIQQATLDGLTLELRRALIDTALTIQQYPQTSSSPLLVIGGDLPNSAWGNPAMARATFHYLAAHPWIRPLTANDLLSAGTSIYTTQDDNPVTFSTLTTPEEFQDEPTSQLVAALHNAPVNALGLAAFQAYQALYEPVYPASTELPALRANYLGQVWSLLAAAQWADHPQPIFDCTIDVDHDIQPECILASDDFYTQVEAKSGSLTYAFAIETQNNNSDTVHQLVAPSSQFIVGLSESATWDLSRNLDADPSVIPGAFTEPNESYRLDSRGNTLIISSSNQQIRKELHVINHGILIDYYFSGTPIPTIQIPLALDPWKRFANGWSTTYQQSFNSSGAQSQFWTWQLGASLQVQVAISIDAKLTAHTFTDTHTFMSYPEDPNLDYPIGHYLPFPMALVIIHPQGNHLQIKISIL